jgi:hypothetical protein
MAKDGVCATRLLLATRFVRSIGQGALAVDFTLYLRALGWSAVAISAVLSVALIAGVVLTLVAGPLSDRGGRRRVLFAYEAAQTLLECSHRFPRSPCFSGLRHWWVALAVAAMVRPAGLPGWVRSGRCQPLSTSPIGVSRYLMARCSAQIGGRHRHKTACVRQLHPVLKSAAATTGRKSSKRACCASNAMIRCHGRPPITDRPNRPRCAR